MIVKYARNVFIDSEINQIGDGESIKLNFPPSTFSILPNEQMRLTLTTADIRRNWYNINKYNNKFYWYDPTGVGSYTELVVPEGSYTNFNDTGTVFPAPPVGLGDAIRYAINSHAPLVGTTVSYNEITRKYTLDLTGAAGALNNGSGFVAFQVKTVPAPPTGVSADGYFGDFGEIIGGYFTRDNWTDPRDLFTGLPLIAQPVATTQITPFVAQLNTIEAIYIRTNLHSGNMQTFSFERDLPNQQGLTPTEIFARIPISSAYNTPDDNFIVFEDPNGLFSMYLNQTQLSQVYFRLCDDKNREIPTVAPDQAKEGNLNFKISFRWEVLHDELPPNALNTNPDNVRPSQMNSFSAQH